MSDASDGLFRALADPTRRRMLDLLQERGALTVTELAAEFPALVTSNISKHLMALRAAKLVGSRRRGRQQVYRIRARAMADAMAPWLARYAPHWSAALERLRELAENEA